MCESRQSGYDINYFDISSAKANAISLSPLAFRIHRRGADLSLYPFQSDGGCFFNSREEGTDGRGLCCGDLQEVNRKKKKKEGKRHPAPVSESSNDTVCPVPGSQRSLAHCSGKSTANERNISHENQYAVNYVLS